MFITILAFITAVSIAGVAAWYSIAGLTAIFSGAVIPIIVMGAVLEVGKLVTASWLYRNWKETGVLLRSYLTIAVVALMLITSIGIFGFLSKAHLDQTIKTGGNNSLQITNLERQIQRQRGRIADAENVIEQLDSQVNTLVEYDRIRGETGSIATRQRQAPEREALSQEIDDAYNKIDELNNRLTPLKQEQIGLEAEVGPLKYVAELIYGDEARSHFDEAVRLIILILIFAFDPLAVLLLIAANQSLLKRPVIVKEENINVVASEDILKISTAATKPKKQKNIKIEKETKKPRKLFDPGLGRRPD